MEENGLFVVGIELVEMVTHCSEGSPLRIKYIIWIEILVITNVPSRTPGLTRAVRFTTLQAFVYNIFNAFAK